MNKDKVVIDILSDTRLFKYFNYLKTSNWKKLSENKRKNFFIRFNKLLAESLKIDPLELVINDSEMGTNNFYDNSLYKNVVVIDETLTINDINYNQYLTIYEYLCMVRMHLQENAYYDEYSNIFSDEKLNEISKVYKSVTFGGVTIRNAREDGDPYEDYQYTNKEAREFARVIVFEIIKRNYNETDGYDEEFFMSNYNIMDNEYIEEVGETNLLINYGVKSECMYSLDNLKRMVNKLDNKNLSSIKDEELFFIVYPSIIENSDTQFIINGFNEIIKRIYSEDIKIVWDNRGIVINDNSYSIKDVSNLLNVVLYECLNDLDRSLREENVYNESEIISYKKRWLLSVIKKIDISNLEVNFGVLNYQSVYRLLNKENINSILENTKNEFFPLSRRRIK